MRILLDSHILLWALTDSDRLPENAKQLIRDKSNDVFYSAVSVWELSVKHDLRPDEIPFSADRLIRLSEDTDFAQLVLKGLHSRALETLNRPADAPKHKDPFDRMLIAQAKSEGMTFMTHDSLLPYYGEPCIMLV